jgi:hypothetical protein
MPKSSKRSNSQSSAREKRKQNLPDKRKRQYEHVLESEREQGRDEKSAKRIAMATVNKTRSEKGEIRRSA